MLAKSIVMVRPLGGAFNPETAQDNAFQMGSETPHPPTPSPTRGEGGILHEFDHAVQTLEAAGIEVILVEGDADLPDAHFPNNWFSTHPDGRLLVYQMAHSSRQKETRLLPRLLHALDHYKVKADTMPEGETLEGTGSLVFDHDRNLAFAALSPRTRETAVQIACEKLGYEPVIFQTKANIYHTNVCLAIGPDWAILCADALTKPDEVIRRLQPKAVHIITEEQMNGFAANVLALESGVAMSAAADRALGDIDLGPRIVAAIPTVERLGGGSLRCMIAENFLPKRETHRV